METKDCPACGGLGSWTECAPLAEGVDYECGKCNGTGKVRVIKKKEDK